ncbi:hypothetical protein FHX63_005256 [Cupriavidus plantarum]|nr:hypothetical protein [Cupriavidus plantarum]
MTSARQIDYPLHAGAEGMPDWRVSAWLVPGQPAASVTPAAAFCDLPSRPYISLGPASP